MRVIDTLVFFAAKTTAREKLSRVPKQTWINLAIGIVAVIVVVRLWKVLKKVNDYAPYFVAMLAATMIFFHWVYNRTEPKILTPVVERLAPFFPSKAKQQADMEKLKRVREDLTSPSIVPVGSALAPDLWPRA